MTVERSRSTTALGHGRGRPRITDAKTIIGLPRTSARARCSPPGRGEPAAELVLPLEVEDLLARGWRVGPGARHARRLPRDPCAYVRLVAGCGERARRGRRGGGRRRVAYRRRLRARGLAPASVARRDGAGASLHRFLADEGTAPPTPAPTSRCRACRRPAQGAHRGRGRSAARRRGRRRRRGVRDRACSRCSTAPACASRSWSASRSATSTSTRALLRAFGKGAQGADRADRRAGRAGAGAGSDPRVGRRWRPARWARRGDAEAVFLNARGGRLSRQGAWERAAPLRRGGRSRGQAHAPRAAPLVRHPHARPRGRHPGGAGAARARLDQDHAGVHAGVHRAAVGGVPDAHPEGATGAGRR